jgi:hypothetical protein
MNRRPKSKQRRRAEAQQRAQGKRMAKTFDICGGTVTVTLSADAVDILKEYNKTARAVMRVWCNDGEEAADLLVADLRAALGNEFVNGMAIEMLRLAEDEPWPPQFGECGDTSDADMPETADLVSHDARTVHYLQPVTSRGENWLAENIAEGAAAHGDGILVEHRYIHDILIGATRDGLKVDVARGGRRGRVVLNTGMESVP